MTINDIVNCFFDNSYEESRTQNIIWRAQRIKILKDLLEYYQSVDKNFYKNLSINDLSFQYYFDNSKNSADAELIWCWMPGVINKNGHIEVNHHTRQFFAVAYIDWIKRFHIFEKERHIFLIKEEAAIIDKNIGKNNNKEINKI